jgi:tetratricopeptide (TPR) repeat protein
VGQTPYRLFAEHARRWLWLLGSPDFVFQMAFYAYLRSGGKAALATLAPHDDLVRGNALLLELRALALLDADRKEELAQTEAALRAVGSRNPTVAEDCFRAFRLIGRARRLGWREGELDDVEEVLRRAVRDDPAHRLARALEGWLRFEQRRFDEALAAFERIPPAATPGESAAAAAWRAVCATLVPGDATHRGRMLVWAEEAWRFEPALFDWMFSSVSQGGSAAEACAFYLDASDRWGEAERAWSSMTLRWAGNLAEHAFQDPGRMERLALRAESLWRPRLAADDAEGYDQVVRGWVWTQLPGVEELKDEAKRSSLEERATRTLEWADRGLARTRRLEYDLHVARALAIGLLAHVANDPAERERRREEAVKLRSRLLSEEMLALERSRLRNAGENKGLEAVRETCERDLQVLLNP